VLSRWLWTAGAVLGATRFVLRLADRRALAEGVREVQPWLGQAEVDSAVSASVLFGLLLAAGLVALYAVPGAFAVRGRRWARVVLALVGGAGLVFTLARFVLLATGLSAAAGLVVTRVDLAFLVVTALVDATALALLFTPSVNRHFRDPALGDQVVASGS
jgi:hypothetical protein